MHFDSGNLYHIYNQGNNRQQVFIENEDYFLFLRLIRKYLLIHSEILAYCLMPNHFHLMIQTDGRCKSLIKQGGLNIDPITNSLRKILSGFTHVTNDKKSNSGSIFRQKTKSKCLSDFETISGDAIFRNDYYCNCFYYIHQNPIKSGLVSDLGDWPFSSYLDYAGLRNGTLCNKELASKYGLYNPKTFQEQCKSIEVIDTKFER